MSTVVLAGASSRIGEAMAREFAAKGFDVVLAGRDPEALAPVVGDLKVRFGVESWALRFDALDFESHPTWLEECERDLGRPIDGVVLCHGVMIDPPEPDVLAPPGVLEMIDVNYRAVVSFLDPAAQRLAGRGSGFLCAVTSVAGDRGRASNYHYGSTKAAVSTYLSGLTAKLSGTGVSVTDLRPGTVDTRMTFGKPGPPLVASPEQVAGVGVRAILAGRPVVYAPWYWRAIMLVIRLLPWFVFKRVGF